MAEKDVHFYGATKYAVTALVEGIRRELREKETNIRVAVSVRHDYFNLINLCVCGWGCGFV